MEINFNLSELSGFLTFMFGELDIFLKVLIVSIIMNYLTEQMTYIYLKELNMIKIIQRIIRKLFLIIIVILGTMIDSILNTQGLVRGAIIFFFIAIEGLCILENADKCGVPVPDWLIEKLEKLKVSNEQLTKRNKK